MDGNRRGSGKTCRLAVPGTIALRLVVEEVRVWHFAAVPDVRLHVGN